MTDAQIAQMVAAHPLPAGVPDAVLNKAELKDFFGVSLPTIDAWVASGMPAKTEGTNGRAWEFLASVCWAWKQTRDADEQRQSEEAQAAIAAMRLNLVGGRAGDSIAALPAKEQRELYAVRAAYEQLKRETNQSFDREDVLAAFEELLSLFRDSVNAYPDRLEREAGLSGKAVEQVIEMGDQLLDQVERRIADFFAARPVRDRPERTDLFNQ